MMTPTLARAPGVEAPGFPGGYTTEYPQPAYPATNRPTGPRRYIYCLADCGDPTSFGRIGIEAGSEVFTIAHNGIATVVSATSAEKLEISRGNALAHQRVMEAVMQVGYTVLPVKFNTIAEGKDGKSAEQRIVDHVLIGRGGEIVQLLSNMRPLVELGVKGLWTDMKAVFADIVESSREIQSLREKLMSAGRPGAPGGRSARMTGRVRLGELVKKALDARKRDTAGKLLGRLANLVKDSGTNKTFGDPMFVNLALLVEKSRQNDVEACLSAFEAACEGTASLRCVGPLPPSNFLELVINWDD